MNDNERARRAAELLDRIMNGGTPPHEPVIVPIRELVIRQSSDILAVPDSDVARALRFVWDNFGNWRLGVEDIAREVGVGYRTLHRAFRKHLGRSVWEEVNRKRMETATALLAGTSLPVAQVARQCGFHTNTHFGVALKRLTGLSPREYRRRAAIGDAPEIPFLHPRPEHPTD